MTEQNQPRISLLNYESNHVFAVGQLVREKLVVGVYVNANRSGKPHIAQ